jgi:hypothetical protein
VGNLTPVTNAQRNRRLGLGVGVILGVIGLALLVVFGVLLPELTDEEAVELPDALPGGWVAADVAASGTGDDRGSGIDARERATEYVRAVYADACDEPVAFRDYADADLSTFVVVTVFTSDGGAFGPPNGVADPEQLGLKGATTELVRRGDVLCIANHQPVAEGADDTQESATPLGVTCQLPTEGRTIQLATNGLSLDDTIDLVHEVADRI